MLNDISELQISQFQKLLLEWYRINGRSLPWRISNNPYHNLLAEYLLQKTNAEKVVPVYLSLINQYPTVGDLAEAKQTKLMNLLMPLGLFYRAERLLSAVKLIVGEYDGKVPSTLEQLKNLPGVGDYMANAILCFAYGQPKALIDTNSARKLSRVWDLSVVKRPRTDKYLWQFAAKLVPTEHSREYNWALIDLAHFMCTPKKPKREFCPVVSICRCAECLSTTQLKTISSK